MSDFMRIQSFDVLLNWILSELEERDSIFGIHRSLFYTPQENAPYATTIFEENLATPIGPGAGPHTQLAQNIIAAWLSGGRFIELKTVQIMDELEIPRPCIDMADEGYNVEWSQELKLEQSALEYIKAWVLIHALRRVLPSTSSGQSGFEETPFGTVFNMSVGYDLEGIQQPRMIRFMNQLDDASEEIDRFRTVLKEKGLPADLEIPTRIVNSVTLSTMHGCPPDEIEQIAQYLMEERGLHTFVKLNPTLLGKAQVMEILHERLGFTAIDIPDAVFDHDLQYDRALELIENLQTVAAERDLTFGVKLSNTLAMANHRDALPGDEMYMSGRALYPITMNLFRTLSETFDGDLNVSYSAGADALNVATILSCGALPVTAVSDILKPGGYSRFLQYLENLEREMEARGADSLEELAADRAANLERAAEQALEDVRYKKSYHPYELPKVSSGLELFDCIAAPCVEQCAVLQDVPEYAWLISQGEYDRALEVILARNPLPGMTGYVCTHLCQTRCTRNNYDEPVAIRALKRFAEERGKVAISNPQSADPQVAIIGSGPAGLAAAYFLALNGIKPVLYEAKDRAGGMPALAPSFRLPHEIVQADVERIKALGAELVLNHPVTEPPEALLEDGAASLPFSSEGFEAVYIAAGAQKDARLGIEGEDGARVFHALDLLERVACGEEIEIGGDVLVIGGGNTAMDAARTAKRLTDGDVTVVYRRTRQEMPADAEEVEAIFAEGIALEELVSPARIVLEDGQGGAVAALECVRNELGEPGQDGRRRPVPIEGSRFELEAGAIIVAIGQRPDVTFLEGSAVSLRENGTIDADPTLTLQEKPVYAGGDIVRGPATIIEACADGRSVAEAICRHLGVNFSQPEAQLPTLSEEEIVAVKQVRARREAQQKAALLPPERRGGFDLVEMTLTEEQALTEAARCMQCSQFCDKCVEVCPNRANYAILVEPRSLSVPVLACGDGELEVVGTDNFRVTQGRQIIHVADFCNECGNCATFCVHQGKPYLDKPRIFLNEVDFLAAEDNAFIIERSEEGRTIRRREGGAESRLKMMEDGMLVFTNAHLSVRLTPDFEIEALVLEEPFEGELSLVGAAEMAVILEGAWPPLG